MTVRSKVAKKITTSFKILLLSHRNLSHFGCGIALLIDWVIMGQTCPSSSETGTILVPSFQEILQNLRILEFIDSYLIGKCVESYIVFEIQISDFESPNSRQYWQTRARGSDLLPFGLRIVYPGYFPSSKKTKILNISNHLIPSRACSGLVLQPYFPTALSLQA